MANVTHDLVPLAFQPGDMIPFNLNGGIVAASFFVSLLGAITTVELLQRRTGAKGWTTWIELFSCSISFGLVAIWCMHYVGNRGIILGGGDPRLQLVYNNGYTALSSIIPIVALFIAFTIADRRHRGKKFLLASLVLAGICAGLAIVGMHYTANLGVTNYDITFDQKYVGGAILIACSACVLALALIFMLQDLWINYFYMRIVCALVLAGAVTGMHYEGTVGTSYKLKYAADTGSNGLRNTNVVTAVVISVLSLPVCLLIAIKASRRQKQLADRAQQVVLACARFDPEGRLMVTHEGLLPSIKMTLHENQKSFEDQFNITHPAFQWIFRVSHNWGSIVRWLPNMRRHLQSVHMLNDPIGTKSVSVDSSLFEVNSEVEDYSIIFRESFCCAAASLASTLKTSVVEVGELYAEVMMTGTLNIAGLTGRKSLLNRLSLGRSNVLRDTEANMGMDIFGKGQLLLLVHQCDKKETAALQSDGYRFTPIDKIAEHLARSMRVPLNYFTGHLLALQAAAKSETDVPRGTMLGCFALRAGVSRRTWEVLVKKDMPYRLPWVSLSPDPLDASSLKLLAQMDGVSVAGCLTRINQRLDDPAELNIAFFESLAAAITALGLAVPESFFRQAVFAAKCLKITTLIPGSNQIASCDLLAFHIIPDIHASTLKASTTDVEYTPLSFLRCRQQVLEGAMQKAAFERKVHHEFASMFASKDHHQNTGVARPAASRRTTNSNMKSKFGWNRAIPLKALRSHEAKELGGSGSDEDESVRSGSPEDTSLLSMTSDIKQPGVFGGAFGKRVSLAEAGASGMPFGGIMVSSDVTVETSTNTPASPGGYGPGGYGGGGNGRGGGGAKGMTESTTEFAEGVGTSAYAETVGGEVSTYVDELYALAVQKWQQR